VSRGLVLAADGGNSKTDVAIVRTNGEVLALVRGPLSSPHHLGLDASVELLEELATQAAEQAGLDGARPLVDVASLMLAGLDLEVEERAFEKRIAPQRWAERTLVGNDTFALLRAGAARGFGVAVVCGAGINCLGVAPDGRHARFPALGEITGDWGGGYDLGLAALAAAARSEDGRGPRTLLERAVPAHFGLETPREVGEAIHFGRLQGRQVADLAPVVLAAAADDAVAAEIVARLAAEVVTMARVAMERLDPLPDPVEVVLGGGVLQSGDPHLLASIEAGLRGLGRELEVHVVDAPPIAGAVLLALDAVDAPADAGGRARRELGALRSKRLEATGG
jgi:N-acetylglucosamine kinase-like BadF-type ATPase